MRRILLIKLTSLGDLIHALPALTDALLTFPDITFDWVIDENFCEVASWHPAVRTIFTTNHRSWRKGLLSPTTFTSMKHLIEAVRQTEYDLVIDGQGNFKTGLLSFFMRGPRAGFDRHSVREWLAHLAYQRRYAASKEAHAVDRLRQLFASALGYPKPLSAPKFLIQRAMFVKPDFPLPEEYVVFVHSASWKTKLWPESHWIELIQKTTSEGLHILLPWGTPQERERAERLAVHPYVHILPKLPLSQIAYILERAIACVAMDTGLSHLIAALEVPSTTLYGSTNAGLIGASGAHQIHLSSTLSCAPCEKKKCRFSSTENPCLKEISPDRVFKELMRQIKVKV